MTKIDEEAQHAAKMAFADAMTKQRIGIGSLDRDDLALVAEKTDAMLESALSAYLTALEAKGYVIVPVDETAKSLRNEIGEYTDWEFAPSIQELKRWLCGLSAARGEG